MKIQNYTRIIIGSFVFISAFLGYFYNHYFLFFTMFVGLNLFQFGFTGFCPLVIILKKLDIEE